MKVYFVRHGETQHTALSLHQTQNSKLSKNGKKQAAWVAKRLSKVNFDVIICSKLLRAKETAAAISKATGKKIIYTSLLNEWRRPSELNEVPHGAPTIKHITKEILDHIDDQKWHYSDEENKKEFVRRTRKLLAYLSRRKEKAIVVVTHGNTVRVLLLQMLLGKEVEGKKMWKMLWFFKLNNTGITEVERTEDKTWRLITWNDVTHLH
jgi:probable phosphoglycerate mutase